MIKDLEKRVSGKLWPPGGNGNVYAIVDGARNEQIYDAVLSSRLDSACLYSGNIPKDLAKVAPYLVSLQDGHPFTLSLIKKGWGDSWGIFLRSPAGMSELRKHFHSF